MAEERRTDEGDARISEESVSDDNLLARLDQLRRENQYNGGAI